MAEMKAGYKQTDIGVIPEAWDIKSYGEIFDFLSTISNSRADLCFKGDFGYIHYGDIHTRWENTLDLSKNELPELRRDKIKKLPASLRDGDLVMADASEDYEGIAKTVEVKNIGEKKVFSGLHTFLMRDRNTVFSDGIRGYIHEMPVVRQQIQKVATGLKVFGVSKNTLKNVQIPVPKPEEQKQIAAALSDVDGLIESLSQLIAKKRDMKTAAMQQLLTGKKRLPGFKTSGMQSTDVGETPDDWETLPLHSVCIKDGLIRGPFGGSLKKDSFSRSGYKVYTQQNAIYRDEELGNYFVPEEKYRELSRFSIQEDDFIVSCSGTIGRLHRISSSAAEGIINQALLIIRINQKISKRYFEIIFRSNDFQSMIIDSTQGGAMQNLVGMSVFRETPIILPSLQEQNAIVSILSDMDTEIDTLEQRLAKARSLKTGMMQELLTGRTRLIKTNKKQEAA